MDQESTLAVSIFGVEWGRGVVDKVRQLLWCSMGFASFFFFLLDWLLTPLLQSAVWTDMIQNSRGIGFLRGQERVVLCIRIVRDCRRRLTPNRPQLIANRWRLTSTADGQPPTASS